MDNTLHGWKEISSYLGVTERTAQYWETERDLPVRRIPGKRGRVYASMADLDQWRTGTSARRDRVAWRQRRLLVLGIGAVVGLCAAVFVLVVLQGDVNRAARSGAEPNLVAHWDFEGGRGPVVVDRSGNGHDGLIQGEITWARGHVAEGRHSLELDGVSTFVEVPIAPGLLPEDHSYTLSAWISTSQTEGQQAVVQSQVMRDQAELNLGLQRGRPRFRFNEDDHAEYVTVTSRASVADDEWHQIVGVRHREHGSVVLYMDGREVARILDTAANVVIPATGYLNLGRRGGSGGERYFRGRIDEVRIYDGALSAPLVAEMFQSERPREGASPGPCVSPPSGVVAWWDGEVTNDGVAEDIMRRFVAAATGPVRVVPGKVGSAFEIVPPGYFRVGGEVQPRLTDQMSVEGWVRSDGREHAYQTIVSRGYAADSPFELRVSRMNDSGHAALSCETGDRVLFFSVTTEEQGRSKDDAFGVCYDGEYWHHVAGTYDGSRVRLYLDGEMRAERPHKGYLKRSERPVTIGWNYDRREHWLGLIDELTLYDRAIRPSSIRAIYEAGEWGKCKPH